MNRIGVDLGGTKTEGILLDGSLNVVKRKRIPTPRDSYSQTLCAIESLVSELSGNAECMVGVGTPGTISKVSGLIKNSNTQCLANRPLREDLEDMLGRKIALENDANCFAVAEATLGSAVGFPVVFGVIMGTGVGGGITINGKIHHGRSGIAGEWGHHTLYPHGNPCYCGKAGCVETYLSGPSLEKRWLETTGRRQTMPEIIQDINSPMGQRFKDDWMRDFGAGLANVIDILDPDAIVLGGGLSNVGFLYTDGTRSVHEKVFSDVADTPILKNRLGDSAGVFGAALLN